ncbi:MAG: S8 family serine peptidase [Streptosporangiaceae bacterium]
MTFQTVGGSFGRPARRARARRGPAARAGLVTVAGLLMLATVSAPMASAAGRQATTQGPSGLRAACPAVPEGYMRCLVLYRTQTAVNRAIAAGMAGTAARPVGLTARQLEAAYRLPVSRRSHQTVAVSIAYDTPKLARYLAMYRKQFGLPPCTIASGCFRKVNQNGKVRPLPPSGVGSGWDLEATLDVSMISAACPHCRILVVEGDDPSFANLAKTDDTAARLGAQVISNSYGTRENGFALAFARAYHHPGHVITVSSGDYGFSAANFPADLTSVTAVGGTILSRAHDRRGWRERVWNTANAGASSSGCSAYVAKPAWQHDRACPGRTVADVAAVAWNIPIYNKDYGGWVTVGGTSVSAPFIAGVYGLAGNATRIRPGYSYRHARSLFEVTTGNNAFLVPLPGIVCGYDYLCVAKKGYNGPTGLGTPNGLGAF